MKKIIDELINSSISGVDVYRWKDSTWLIFTDEVRWVLELTDNGTLWYNYRFFNDVFKYVSMKGGKESEEYITQWANDYFYKGVEKTEERGKNYGNEFEWNTLAVIGKGIKEVNDTNSIHKQMRAENLVGRIIRDVKPNIEYSEQTGVYDPDCNGNKTEIWRIVEEVKPNLVDILFEEQIRCYHDPTCNANNTMITDIIEGGVKEVKPNVVFHGIDKSSMSFVLCNGNTTDINIIVKSGIKNIYADQNSGDDGYNWSNEFDADKVIEYGVKL